MLKRSKAPVQRLSEENLGWTTGSSKEIKFIDQEQSVKDMPESNHDNISMQRSQQRGCISKTEFSKAESIEAGQSVRSVSKDRDSF